MQERPDKRSPRAFPNTVSIIQYVCTRIVYMVLNMVLKPNMVLNLRKRLKHLKKEYPRGKQDAKLDLST